MVKTGERKVSDMVSIMLVEMDNGALSGRPAVLALARMATGIDLPVKRVVQNP